MRNNVITSCFHFAFTDQQQQQQKLPPWRSKKATRQVLSFHIFSIAMLQYWRLRVQKEDF